MAIDFALTHQFVEDYCEESSVAQGARTIAAELAISPLSPATCQFIRFFVGTTRVRSVVEVGTGTGVCSLHVLEASPDVTLTSIDSEADAQHYAREAFRRAGIRSGRARLIHGNSADILPRLAESSYDLIILDGNPQDTPEDLNDALRLLRRGGSVIIPRALMGEKVADPARREDAVVAMRELTREVMEDTTLLTSLIPLGDGILLATKQ